MYVQWRNIESGQPCLQECSSLEEASAVYLGPVFCPLWTELSLEVVVTPPVSAAPGCPTPSGAPPSAIHPAELS